jgi:AcrR family transcriptional regulator
MRDRLVIEAARLFRSHGYAGTSTRTLAESLGLTKAALYHHFRNKDALLLEICLESIARIEFAVSSALLGVGDSLERLRAAVIAHVGSALRDADMHATMLIEMRALSPADRDEVRRVRAGYEARIRSLIEAAQRDRYLRAEPDARWLTLALLNTLNWSIFWYRPDGDSMPEEIGARLLDVFLNGVLSSATRELPATGSAGPPPATSQLDRIEAKLDALQSTLPSLSAPHARPHAQRRTR